MVAITMFSCTENEIIVNVERVPCEFHASKFTADVDDVKPMTKTGELREIWYHFYSANDTVISGSCVEQMPFKVYLKPNVEYIAKFITSPEVNSINDSIVNIGVDPKIFNHMENIMISKPGTKRGIELKHLSGKYVAKVGKIPANYEVRLTVLNYSNQYNWINHSNTFNNVTENYISSEENAELYSNYVTGNTIITVKVGLLKGNQVFKEMEYSYMIPRSSIRTITYSINNVSGSDEFEISINEKMEELKGEDQQIGKPQ